MNVKWSRKLSKNRLGKRTGSSSSSYNVLLLIKPQNLCFEHLITFKNQTGDLQRHTFPAGMDNLLFQVTC